MNKLRELLHRLDKIIMLQVILEKEQFSLFYLILRRNKGHTCELLLSNRLVLVQ